MLELNSISPKPLSRTLVFVAAIPLVLLALATLLFRFTNLDIEIASLFFDEQTLTWPWRESFICRLGFHVLPIPGILLGLFGGIVALSKRISLKTRIPRSAGVFLFMVLLVGPGMVVNGVLKPLWTRPRPLKLQEFNGKEAFAPVLSSGFPSASRSFPSGHASMGFIWIAPAFLLFRRRRVLAMGFVVLGLSMGGLLGLVRMAEGGHFASDVVWSLGFVYMTCIVVALAQRGSEARLRKRGGLRYRLLKASHERWLQLLAVDELAANRSNNNATEDIEPDQKSRAA